MVDFRKSAEAISMTYLHCILKGLHKSPKIIPARLRFGGNESKAENLLNNVLTQPVQKPVKTEAK